MPRFVERLRRRRPADDQALLSDIVNRQDEASGAAAQRGRPTRPAARETARRVASVPRHGHRGWLRLVVLLSVFAGLLIYVVVDPPTFRSGAPPEQIDREYVGTVHVIDGDTVVIRDRRLRLDGIDAPELMQTCTRDGGLWHCGEQSSAALARWVGERTLICLGKVVDRYGRPLVRCTVGGSDVGAWSLGNGWSIASPNAPRDYREQEDQARRMRQGLWSGEFVSPREWRDTHGIDNQ